MQKQKTRTGTRLTLPQARKALGMIGRNYSDGDIEEILRLMRDVAELAYEENSR
ncbi:MAG: hypothetical protein COA60_003995 [Robiginitomaculum sp.]|nr:hypothetical protein [Robiginitomaculum sp.]